MNAREVWQAKAERLTSAFARAVEAAWGNSAEETRLAYIEAERALLAHISAPPEGYVLVPVEPTVKMADVGAHVNSEWLNDIAPLGERRYRLPAIAVYKYMIAAAKEE